MVHAEVVRCDGAAPQLGHDRHVVPVDRQERQDDDRHRDDHDPCALDELRVGHDDEDQERGRGTDRVDHDRSLPPFGRGFALVLLLQPMTDHPRLRQRERREHAHHVQLDQLVEVGVEHQDQQARERAEHDHAVREHQPVAAVRELPGHEPVARQDRREAREVLVGRVGREHQDRRREELHEVEEEPAAEHRVRDLADDRPLLADRDPVDVGRQVGDPQEHRDRDDPHDQQGLGGVLRLRAAERRHAVRDRLDAGERGRARRERVQDHEQPDRADGVGQLGDGTT